MRRWKTRCVPVAAALVMTVFWSGTTVAASESADNAQCAQIELDTDGWEEEYTDTDIRRGILSIRCHTFRGFHGTVELCIRNMDAGWERHVTLTEGGGYALNISLPEKNYQIVKADARTDGRQYDCNIRQTELTVLTEKITVCQIIVRPDSLYQFSYENDTLSDTDFTGADKLEGQAEESSEKKDSLKLRERNRIQLDENKEMKFLRVTGILGLATCAGGIFYLKRRKNE